MANTTTMVKDAAGNLMAIVVTGLVTDDWTLRKDAGLDSVQLQSVTFIPSAISDRAIVTELGFDTGIVSSTDARTLYLDKHRSYIPTIDISTWTLGVAANAKLILKVV